MLKKIYTLLNLPRLVPHAIAFTILSAHHPLRQDLARWKEVMGMKENGLALLMYLLANYPEFRSIFYYRLKHAGKIIGIIFPPEKTLFISTHDIGPGLFIQHGFATIIAAKKIGANFWVNQQVTIGFSGPDACPTIGDNVRVGCGSQVLGAIVIGNGAKIGAGATVVKDVPAGHTAMGPAATIVPSRQPA